MAVAHPARGHRVGRGDGVVPALQGGGVGGERVEVGEEGEPAERAWAPRRNADELGARGVRLHHEGLGQRGVAPVHGPAVGARGAPICATALTARTTTTAESGHGHGQPRQSSRPRSPSPEPTSLPGHRSTSLPDHRCDPTGTGQPVPCGRGGVRRPDRRAQPVGMPKSAGTPPLHSPAVPESTAPAPPPVFGRADIRKKTRKSHHAAPRARGRGAWWPSSW